MNTGPTRRVRNLTVLTKKPGLDRARFSEHWLDIHGPMVARMSEVRRYSQLHVVSSEPSPPGHDYGIDGIVDFMFDDEDSIRQGFDSDLGREIMADALGFIASMRVFTVDEHVLVDRTTETAHAKHARTFTPITRRSDLDGAAFADHWLRVHAPLVLELPGLLRYSQFHVLASDTRSGFTTRDYDIDGFAELVYADADAMTRAFETEIGRRVAEDARSFIGAMRTLQVREHVIVDRRTGST